ncbi:hypothetical protein [Clostridium uliginosum]|uniref:ABC-2 family transporter protein n=1 Tax=Clostridium uliginosum TaxID=119641 RepID=A0A1I1NW59_9CLOT|nr:hypothetical protein [Clostridium uliginosum]SFD01924.1 hypothetical protein SAMN05421842_11719 [Clostridium uliginosum]
MIALLKYNYKFYIKCNKFMIPLLFFCLFQLIFYSEGPVHFTSSIMICSNVLFCIMTWIAFIYCETQDVRTEQIVFLKVNNNNSYWLSKIIFLWIVGIVLSFIGVIWPIIANLVKAGAFFENNIGLIDLLLAFLIQVLVAFMGLLLGFIFQTKITGTRNVAVTLLFLCTLLSIVKCALVNECPIAKTIMWIFPPVSEVINSCMTLGKFSISILTIPIVHSVFYILILSFIYLKLMKKLLF